MVDATQAMESNWITVDLVKASPTKKCVILPEAKYVDTEYGAKLELTVEIDKKNKTWKPNKDTLKNITEYTGTTNTDDWVGVVLKLSTSKFNGKDTINGVPVSNHN